MDKLITEAENFKNKIARVTNNIKQEPKYQVHLAEMWRKLDEILSYLADPFLREYINGYSSMSPEIYERISDYIMIEGNKMSIELIESFLRFYEDCNGICETYSGIEQTCLKISQQKQKTKRLEKNVGFFSDGHITIPDLYPLDEPIKSLKTVNLNKKEINDIIDQHMLWLKISKLLIIVAVYLGTMFTKICISTQWTFLLNGIFILGIPLLINIFDNYINFTVCSNDDYKIVKRSGKFQVVPLEECLIQMSGHTGFMYSPTYTKELVKDIANLDMEISQFDQITLEVLI